LYKCYFEIKTSNYFLYLAICKTEKRMDTKQLIVDQNGKSEVKKVTMKPTYLSSYLSILVFTLLLMVYLTFYGINIRDFDYLQRSKSKQDSKFKLHNISKTSVASRHGTLGPKSMEIYRWHFKILSKFWNLVRTFICVKYIFCMFLQNWYRQELIDNSYSNMKIFQNSMVNQQFAKLWIVLANKFSELLLQVIVLYKQIVQ